MAAPERKAAGREHAQCRAEEGAAQYIDEEVRAGQPAQQRAQQQREGGGHHALPGRQAQRFAPRQGGREQGRHRRHRGQHGHGQRPAHHQHDEAGARHLQLQRHGVQRGQGPYPGQEHQRGQQRREQGRCLPCLWGVPGALRSMGCGPGRQQAPRAGGGRGGEGDQDDGGFEGHGGIRGRLRQPALPAPRRSATERPARAASGRSALRGPQGLAQAAQHVAHHLRPVLRVRQFALDAQLFVARELDVPILLDQVDDLHRVHRRLGPERDVRHARCRIHLDDPVGLRQHAQPVHVDQRLRLRRQLAEAVHDFLEQGVDLVRGLRGGELLVERQAQVDVAAVVVGQQGRRMQVDVRGDRQGAQQVGLLAGLERLHGLAQHLVVELEAHLQHVAALVLAQHLARAADFQVVHGEVEARTQLLHLLDGVQPLGGLLGQAIHVRHHQVGIGLVVAAAHAAAQLMQLRQAELVGAAHDDGVGRGHVDAGLDDGRAQQDVVALRHEVAHHLLQLALGHLAVGHGDARLGQYLLELMAAVLDGLHLVVQEVALAAALQLAQHRLADHARALVAHEGLDRQAPLRRGGDHRQVAQAFQRHAQRARDGGSGEREHVHFGAQLLHLLLVAHPEAVLLVDDEQAQVVELGGFTQQLVRAHHDVHRAVADALDGRGDLLAGAEARDLRDLHRPLGEAVHQRLVVLLGQQRGRREEGHLLAAGHRHEGRAQGDFGLAEAHVAADQPVHGAGRDHVLDHRVDGGVLVGRLLEAEIVGELLVVLRAVAEGVALACRAARVDVEQLGGGVAHLLCGLALGFFPLPAAQFVQGRLVGRHARVAADELQLADRHVEHGLVGVFEVQELLHGGRAVGVLLAHVHVDQAPVAADAVRAVHHRVAQRELRQVLDERLDIAHLLLLLAPARGGAGREELGLGDEIDAFLDPGEARGQGGGGDADPLVSLALELGQRIEGRRVQLRGAQEVQQALAPAVAFGQQQHAVLRVADVRMQARQRILGAAHHRQIAQLLEVRVVGHVLHARPQRELRMRVGAGVELLGAQEQRFGRQRGPVRVALHQAEAVLRVLPEALEGRLQVAMQHHGGVLSKIVEHGGRLVEEERQVVLDAGGGHAVAHVLVDAAFGGVALQQFAPAAAELGPGRIVHGELAAGQQAHLGHGVEAALRVRIEGADGVDLVVEQVHPVGHGRAHGEEVDQAAAHRVFARSHHLRDVAVAGQRELGAELRLVQLLLDLEMEGVGRQERGRREAVERRGGRHQHHVGAGVPVLLADAPERGQALADEVLVRRERVVGQRFPVGEQRAAQLGREERHLVDQALRVGGVGRDDGGGAPGGLLALRDAREQQGVRAAHGARHGETFAGDEFGEVHGEAGTGWAHGSAAGRARCGAAMQAF